MPDWHQGVDTGSIRGGSHASTGMAGPPPTSRASISVRVRSQTGRRGLPGEGRASGAVRRRDVCTRDVQSDERRPRAPGPAASSCACRAVVRSPARRRCSGVKEKPRAPRLRCPTSASASYCTPGVQPLPRARRACSRFLLHAGRAAAARQMLLGGRRPVTPTPRRPHDRRWGPALGAARSNALPRTDATASCASAPDATASLRRRSPPPDATPSCASAPDATPSCASAPDATPSCASAPDATPSCASAPDATPSCASAPDATPSCASAPDATPSCASAPAAPPPPVRPPRPVEARDVPLAIRPPPLERPRRRPSPDVRLRLLPSRAPPSPPSPP